MNRTQDTIILEKIFNERLELSIYKNRGQFYLTKNLRKQFRHKIEINIDVKNQKRLIIKELDEGNVQQNFYSKKLAQHISDLVGVNGNMKFLFIRDEADNCWIGVLLPEMADSYLWGINMCQKKEYLSDGEDYKTIHGWDDLDSAEEEDVKLFVDHISVICLLYNMFFKKECFAQEQEYRMVFLCVHKREHQVPENSIPVEYRIKDEVFIPFIRMKLGDISCLKSVCVGTKNTSDLAVKGLRHYFGSRDLEVRVKKSEIPLRY